jgi:DNA modification methylase
MGDLFLNGKIELHCGDCLAVLPALAENSIDACVTDPPYHLTSIAKRFGGENAAPVRSNLERDPDTIQDWGRTSPYQRAASGFMGKQWDGGDIAFRPDVWREVYRVLKPGAHLLAFGGTRTYHRMACAIEDAGFEIRDTIMWVYGSGFPKSHDVSKGIDRAAGAERKVAGQRKKLESYGPNEVYGDGPDHGGVQLITAPATAAARQWEGWGTALKPACEPIVVARKPLSEGTVAANVLRWGTGAINVNGCRVAGEIGPDRADGKPRRNDNNIYGTANTLINPQSPLGRWPSNLIHDGSEEVLAGFPDSESSRSVVTSKPGTIYGNGSGLPSHTGEYGFDDSGSAARFFYTAKADSDDRLGSRHPTVKPLDLMQYLVRLVTPKGGLVLDPFAGTGTTAEAAWREGMRAMLIEREAEYQADIWRRMALVLSGPDERSREAAKARMNGKPRDDGPLFSGRMEWDEMWARPFDYPERL